MGTSVSYGARSYHTATYGAGAAFSLRPYQTKSGFWSCTNHINKDASVSITGSCRVLQTASMSPEQLNQLASHAAAAHAANAGRHTSHPIQIFRNLASSSRVRAEVFNPPAVFQ